MLSDISSIEIFAQGALATVALGFFAIAIREEASSGDADVSDKTHHSKQLCRPSTQADRDLPVVTATERDATHPPGARIAHPSLVPPSGAAETVKHSAQPDTRMRLMPQLFTVPRVGDRQEENCDASATNELNQAFAIADGASQSFNSGEWARLVTSRWVTIDSLSGIRHVAESCSPDWHVLSNSELNSLPPDSLIREKMAQGSSATFGGVRLVRIAGGDYWEITTVGDVLVVATSRKSDGTRCVWRTYPFPIGSQFGEGAPHQVTTDAPFVRSTVSTAMERDSPGLEFVLMTDAIARRIFTELTRNINITELLPFLNQDRQTFIEWVDTERSCNRLDDDDSTVLDLSKSVFSPTEVR